MHDLSCTEMRSENFGYYDKKKDKHIHTGEIRVAYRCYYGKKSRKSIVYYVEESSEAVAEFYDEFGFFPTTVRCEVAHRINFPF